MKRDRETAFIPTVVAPGLNNNGVLDDVDRIPPPSDSNPGGETDENIPGETVDREVGAPGPSAPAAPKTGAGDPRGGADARVVVGVERHGLVADQ